MPDIEPAAAPPTPESNEEGQGAAPPAAEPQPGPQETFLDADAQIAIYGGAAGGGKTWALLHEAGRHVDKPGFSAVVFRRTTVQIRNPGGLWDESAKHYPAKGGKPFSATLEWRCPSGARVKFAYLEHDKTVLEWQGAQLPLICFDELWARQVGARATRVAEEMRTGVHVA